MQGTPIDRIDLGAGNEKAVRNQDFSNLWLQDVNGRDVTYDSCNFSASIIERGYFFHARFKNCNFTGARFVECNFRQATFEQCKFDYADFNRCVVPAPQILANLPSFANVRWELLHNLRANERSIGENRYEAEIVKKEIEAEIEHWRAVRTRPSGYYEKYHSTADFLKAWYHTIRLIVERYVWGHGESLLRLSIAAIVALLLLSILHCTDSPNSLSNVSLGALAASFWRSVVFVFQLFIDLPSVDSQFVRQSPIVSAATVMLRYVVIGLAVPVLYKHIAKR